MIPRAVLVALIVAGTCVPGISAAQTNGQENPGAEKSSSATSNSNSPTAVLRPDSGSVVDNIYTNDFFAFTYEFPKGWAIHSQETAKYLIEVGRAVVTGGDPTKKAISELAARRSYALLSVSEHPVGTPGVPNPAIIVYSEDISYAPGIRTGKDYLLNLKAQFGRNARYKLLSEPSDLKVGGRDFSSLNFSWENPAGAIQYDTFVCAVLKSQVLSFTFTSPKAERLRSMVETLNTLQFEPENAEALSHSKAPSQAPPDVTILTPTEGVDFRPWVNGMLSATKRKWYAVMPDTAMRGTKGKVILVFGIKRDGTLSEGPTVERSSGTAPLDEAALAAIRVAAPFDALPADFKGSFVRLRIIFLYNLPLDAARK